MWNLLCQYNNIYASSLKKKKKHKPMTHIKKKKKKKPIAIVATVSIEQT